MAAYISVPRDLTRVKAKVFMNLTKRQVICFGTAVLIGVLSFFLLKEYAGNTAATLGMMILMLPLFFLAMHERNGQPPEVMAWITPVRMLITHKNLSDSSLLFRINLWECPK